MTTRGVITRGLVLRLGLSQLVCWGVSYYVIALFGPTIAAETGWSRTLVWGGFSAALVVMGLTSPLIGRLVDRHGGRPVMTAGSLLLAAGCLGVAAAHTVPLYYAAWCCLGLAMRLTLYEAAFAALARIGGPHARRPISQITLLGGLASTALWPVGRAVADAHGWRVALVAYAGFALLTIPLHLAIPPARYDHANPIGPPARPPLAVTARQKMLAAGLFVVIATVTSFLNAAMSAHMIPILTGLGMSSGVATWVSTMRGVGQSTSRLGEILFGSRLTPLSLGVLASLIAPIGFVLGFGSGTSIAAGLGFAGLYGAGTGLWTIVRGTQPLVLFDPRSYGTLVGRLVMPSFFLSALAPAAYAAVIERLGNVVALQLSLACTILILLASIALWLAFPPATAAPVAASA